ncbi:MAG TPA: hypothetical protein VFT29_09770 [Gemmatimonadaceae bacterium]|nr:hypothetical protein [Gemmatimonadaceae bacterium]
MKRLALFLPLWLVCAVGEPSLVHQCPMHSMGGAGARQEAPAGHAGHSTEAPAAPHSHGHCSCIGSCTTATGAVVPQVASAPAASIVLAEPLVPAPLHQSARAEAYRLLPYANGPPAIGG